MKFIAKELVSLNNEGQNASKYQNSKVLTRKA
jgi:hypothetical protein